MQRVSRQSPSPRLSSPPEPSPATPPPCAGSRSITPNLLVSKPDKASVAPVAVAPVAFYNLVPTIAQELIRISRYHSQRDKTN